MQSLRASIRSFTTAYPKESYVFIVASLLNAIGNAMLWPLVTIYVHNVLHRSYAEAGVVLLIQSAAGIVGQFLGGSLYHRVGPKRLIVSSLILTGVAQLFLIVAKAWIPYIFIMALNGFLFSVTMPAVNAFVGFRWPDHQARLFNSIYVFNNMGVAIGTSLAGVLAAISFNLTFFIDGISTASFGVFFLVFFNRIHLTSDSRMESGLPRQTAGSGLRPLLVDYRLYLFLALGSMLVMMSTSAWNSGVAAYLNSKGLSPAVYSFLWTVNGIVIVVGQPFTSLLNRLLTRSLYARLISSALFYAVGFCLMLLLHADYIELVIGMIVCTFGEMLLNPSIPAIVSQTTGRSAPFYLGLVGSVGSVGRLVGPPLYGALFDSFGVTPILLVSTVATAVGAGLFVVHRLLRSEVQPTLI
ncbi:MFS transporter [Alicyclobacillus mengziensis]|uniref:MFS transporter n=1 Tax=Alicyclobacillus mengziensis TaxID=2931921 RepID=A0A9X7VWQ0_9BACL|nr:MFS transporter [Alicyclobacillus mengziensis]QSO46034.1 MFS transporter [Alicyclobacillus mengziensis]